YDLFTRSVKKMFPPSFDNSVFDTLISDYTLIGKKYDRVIEQWQNIKPFSDTTQLHQKTLQSFIEARDFIKNDMAPLVTTLRDSPDIANAKLKNLVKEAGTKRTFADWNFRQT
ncbi:MAG: hypothetical protein ACHQIM_17205, partial [Sphingobacteriales bacterium]